GHLVTGLEVDDVARDEVLARHVDDPAVPPRMRLDHEHLLKRRHAGRSLALLVEPEDRVEHREADDRDARAELLQGDHADDRRAEQDELHQVAVLAEEGVPAGLRSRLVELVRADLRPTPLHFGGVEARLRVDTELRTDLVGAEVVPGDRRRSLTVGSVLADADRAVCRRTHRAAHLGRAAGSSRNSTTAKGWRLPVRPIIPPRG